MNPEPGSNAKGLRVDPQLVFGISVLVALAISWPGLAGAMRGSADIMTVGVRFLIGVAVVWTALFCVASLIAGFSATTTRETKATGPVSDRAATDLSRTTTPATPSFTPPVLELDPAQAVAAAQIAAATETAAG